MGTRGRKSSAELATKPLTVLSERRPAPPADLTEAEGAIWKDVTGSMPSRWLTRAQYPLLTAYCRHTARAALLSEQIIAFNSEWLKADGALERLNKLLAMAERESRALNACARALRLTHQSQYGPRAAFTTSNKRDEPRPWDD